MTGRSSPPRWLLHISRALLRRRVSAERADEYIGDIEELWTQRCRAGRGALTLQSARDVAGLLLHFERGYPVVRPALRVRVLRGGIAVLHDIRYSLRLMRRQPLFSALTLATLTLGIAASTGIFTTVDRLLWRPLPFPDPDRLVIVAEPPYSFGGNRMNVAKAANTLPVFVGIGMYATGGVNVDGLGTPVRAAATIASPGFFTALGVPAMLGRPYTLEEDVPDANFLVVVSHRFWVSHLGRDPNVLERGLSINRRPFRITAVMPEGFTFPELTDLWLPSGADRQTTGQAFAPTVVARLAGAVTLAEAEAALIALDKERGAPEREEKGPRFTGLQDELTREVRPTLLLLAMSVGLVLLVATTNVAGLLLARVARRQPEFVMRRALGASRWRLLQLMAIEAVCYASLAGVAGAALGMITLRAFSVLTGGLGPAATAEGIDTRMLLIALAVSACSALLFGLAPGLAAAAHPASRALRSGVTSTRGRGWRWVRSALVVGQVAGALVLLAVTSATTGTMKRLAEVDLAFDGRGVLGLDVTLPTATYGAGPPASLFVERAVARLRAIPGVSMASATGRLPGDRSIGVGDRIAVTGEVRAANAPPRTAASLSASPGYFEAMGIEVVSGRAFTDRDRPGAPEVAIISESTARLLWPDGRSPLGLQMTTGFRSTKVVEVVGVVRDVLLRGPDALNGAAQFYRPIAQYPPFGNVSFAVKTAGDPMALRPAVEAAIAEIDPTIPVYQVRSMAQVAGDFLAAHRLALTVMGLFAVLTMTLAGIGLYGVLAQLIEQQTREIGVRVALGAEPRQVRHAVVSVAVKLAACGVALGAGASGVAASLVASYVPKLDPISWPTVAMLGGVLMVIALIASWVPARRASAIDPIIALRD